MHNTPKLTEAEERKLGKACVRLDDKLRAIDGAATVKLQALETEFRRRRAAILAKADTDRKAARSKCREFEDQVYETILAEEDRTGRKRERAPVDMMRWYQAAGAPGYTNIPPLALRTGDL